MNQNQEKFCKIYAICGNGTRSYKEAYPGSSYESARRSGSELLTNPDIQAKIQEFKSFDSSETVLIANNLKKQLRQFMFEKFEDLRALRTVFKERIPAMNKYNSTELLNMARYNSLTIQDFGKLIELVGTLEGLGDIETFMVEANKDRIGDMDVQYDDPVLPT